MKAQRAITPIKSFLQPFGGNYTWWLNANKQIFSNSGGTDYTDTIPLVGVLDQFEQPTAVERPEYVGAGFDNQDIFQTTINNQKIYKATNTNVFNGGGTFAFIASMNNSVSGQNATFFTEAEANASAYNFQIYLPPLLGSLQIYTPTDGVITLLNPFTISTYIVHHITIASNTIKYYKNGVLTTTATCNQNFTTSRPLTAFGYKSISNEQGIGSMSDVVSLSGSSLSDTDISNDYANFWKKKYPSLP